MPTWGRWRWRALGLPLGALVSLAFPEADLWWLAFVGLVPVVLLVDAADSGREAVWRSWAAGTGFSLGLFHWVLGVLGPFVPVLALAVGATWIPVGVAIRATTRRATTPGGAAVAVAVVPSVWVLAEVVRSWDVFGGSWGFLGLSQWHVRPVLPLAALGGVWGLSWVLVAINVGLAVALRRGATAAVRATALAVPAVLLAAGVGWGLARPDPPVEGHLRIAGVQPGRIDAHEPRLRASEALTQGLDAEGQGVDLVVWGQSSVPYDPATDDEVRTRLEALATEVGVPVLVNVDARRDDGRIAKSAVLVRPDEGVSDVYDKQRLVPFGEYIPLRPVFGWVARFTDAAEEDRLPGGDLTTMEVADVRVGPLISYESTFPDLRRAVADLGAEVTVVQGASTTFQGTWAQPQQASFEAVRAVESGRSAVLVTVSGTSAAFDARGERLAWVPSDETGVVVVDVPVSVERTPFLRWGDWVPLASLAVTVAALAGALVARRRDRADRPTTVPSP